MLRPFWTSLTQKSCVKSLTQKLCVNALKRQTCLSKEREARLNVMSDINIPRDPLKQVDFCWFLMSFAWFGGQVGLTWALLWITILFCFDLIFLYFYVLLYLFCFTLLYYYLTVLYFTLLYFTLLLFSPYFTSLHFTLLCFIFTVLYVTSVLRPLNTEFLC